MCTCRGELPLPQRLNPYGVIEIARGFAVDGDDIQITEIAPAGKLVREDHRGDGSRLLQNLVGKMMRNVMRADQDLDIDAEVAGHAQDLDDPSNGTIAVFAEIQDLRQ